MVDRKYKVEGNSINDHKYIPQDNSLMWLLRMESVGLKKLCRWYEIIDVNSYLGFKSSFDKIIKNKYDSVSISIK